MEQNHLEEEKNIVEDNSIVEDNTMGYLRETREETKVTFSTQDSAFAYVMLALGFCFVHFVLWNVSGLFTTMFFWGTAITCLIYLRVNQYHLNGHHRFQLSLILLFGSVFSITANGFIKFLDIIFVLGLGVYWVYAVCKDNGRIGRFFFFDMLKAVLVMPFSGFSRAPSAIAYTTSQSKHGKNIKLVVIGLITTIPLTMLVGALLISADNGLEKIMSILFSNIHENFISLIIQFFMGVPVAFYMFGMLYTNTKKEKQEILTEEKCSQMMKRMRVSPNMVMYSAVSPICILYILFFISQMQYFLSAFMGRLPETYSLAQYARRGFFELCAIAIINLIIYVVINLFSQNTGEHMPFLLKLYSAMLAVFTLFIIITALSKMILYISQYGLTQLRVYTCWFMILLLFVFIMIICKQIKYHFNLARCFVAVFIVLFGILCFSNVDGIISRYNIEMYKAGNLNELDVEALCYLSDDGLIYILEQGIDTKEYLDDRLWWYKNNPYNQYNLSSYRVMRLLEEKQDLNQNKKENEKSNKILDIYE